MTEDEIGPLYCEVMEELKARVQTLHEVVEGVQNPKSAQHLRHNVFIMEGMYLQLRKCCEILAVGMLVAQSFDERARSKKLLGEYRADKLIERLRNINPLSFPRPVGPGEWMAGEVQLVSEFPPVFDARDIKDLYYECDNRLHWGRLEALLARKLTELRQDDIRIWVRKFMDGLSNHKIDLPQRGRSMLVQMADPETGRVCCRFASLAA